MPNAHRSDTEPISIQIPRPLMVRIKKAAHKRGMSVTNFVATALMAKVEGVALDSEDYYRIAEATRLAEETRKRVATKFTAPEDKNASQ